MWGNLTLVVYILPTSDHVELQLIVNTLSVAQLCTYVPRLFVGRVVVWATTEVEVHVGVFLINEVTQWAIRSPVNIHGWSMAVCLHGEWNVWWTLFSCFTFMLPCIVIDFFLNNQLDTLIIQIYSVVKLYVFRASSLPIIRSFPLYIRHW